VGDLKANRWPLATAEFILQIPTQAKSGLHGPPTGKISHPGSDHLPVQRADVAHHRFTIRGRLRGRIQRACSPPPAPKATGRPQPRACSSITSQAAAAPFAALLYCGSLS